MQLIKEVKTYRCDSEDEANQLIENTKTNCGGEVTKSVIALKTKKSKGEIIASWHQTEITIVYEIE